MDIDAELCALGLNNEDAAQLTALLAKRPVGVLDPEDAAPTSVPEMAMQAALLAARQVSKFSGALGLLLETIEQTSDLSTFDEGRYWHLRGLVAWRVDNRPFDATRALNRSVRALTTQPDGRARAYLARVHDTLGQVLHQQGMMEDALRELRRSLELRDPADAFGRAITHGNLGRLYMEHGNYAAAAEELARDLSIVEQIANEQYGVRAQLASHLAECHLLLGVVDEAEKLFAQSIGLARQCNDAVAESFGNIGLGRLALTRADAPRALALAEEVQARVAQSSLASDTAATLRAVARLLTADAHLHAKRYDKAIQNFRDGLKELGDTSAASPMEYARAYRGLSAALSAKQQYAEAARTLRLALRHLDVTAAVSTRLEVERELQEASRDSWLLHTAGRFLGQQQIEDVLTEGGYEGFRGSKRRVAVLFSDIRGFTSLAESLDPAELVNLLNEFLTHQTRCIDGHGGTVDKFIGDAVMAVFPQDDSGSGAIAAAVAMHDELERFNRYLPSSYPRLAMGIGVHGGSVVSGLIGSAQKREVTVIGDTVNTASRLEGLTKKFGAGTIVSAEALGRNDESQYLLRPLGKVTPRGRRTGVELFDVMGVRDRSASSRSLDAEIGRVRSALDALRERSFDAAARAFEDLANEFRQHPRARGYELLARKAHDLGLAPPPDAWAGDIVLTD